MGRRVFSLRCLTLLFVSTCIIGELTAKIRVVERPKADSMRTVQVVYHDRVCPLNTPAIHFVQQLTGKSSWKGLSPEQIMLSWALYPEDWKEVAMIRITDPQVSQTLGIQGDDVRFVDFFDEQGNYRLPPDKFPDMDERLTLIALLTRGELYHPLPSGTQPLSWFRIQTELLYNAIPWHNIPLWICLLLTVLLFLPQCKRHTTPIIVADVGMLILHLINHL